MLHRGKASEGRLADVMEFRRNPWIWMVPCARRWDSILLVPGLGSAFSTSDRAEECPGSGVPEFAGSTGLFGGTSGRPPHC